MRNSNRWFKLMTILAGSSVLLGSGCGWTSGVDIFYGALLTVLGVGAVAILAAGRGTTP